jgi:hypothetical protein
MVILFIFCVNFIENDLMDVKYEYFINYFNSFNEFNLIIFNMFMNYDLLIKVIFIYIFMLILFIV